MQNSTGNYLHQKSNTGKRIFDLVDDGVEVTETSFLSSRQYKVSFEHIGDETVEVSISSKWSFWLAIGALALATFLATDALLFGGDYGASVFYGLIGLLFGYRFWKSRETFLVHPGVEPSLVFFKDKPTAEELSRFRTHIQRKKQEYLRQNYLPTSLHTTTADELQKLAWLRDQEAINDEEYEALKADIIGNRRNRPLGFN